MPYYYAVLIALLLTAALILNCYGHLAMAFEGGAVCVGVLLVATFVFGQFNRLCLGHSCGPPDTESALLMVVLIGIAVGPIVMIVGGLVYVAIRHVRDR